jgi:metal-responsive CopG/Arc/MetJ family transcriptional regulator
MTQDAILQMRIAADLVVQLDELRRHESDIPSRSEMVRRLISRAAETKQKRETRKR